ncbi:MAG TPA: oxidoreductase [Candidatus Margulisbacteria bacterium]|nr:MAG: oxidoreductase [Candidatus Margulisbacteria bacterium GWD2_39_127]OGI08045.1 MAG: oxidoreductase [Candidatus Margulisbacteria bacterium GWE2_39_32]HAR62877.1 oxidoreductase [Candidatus Margulisiibacteriota bacterium]HCT85453.1 oxidoreductase [Candidatus Margulisiibacteriota bacterium]
MENKVRFALIGCGRVSYKHINALKNIKTAQLVSICDLVEDRARKKADETGVPWYTNYREMLKNEIIDVVIILTESGIHAKIAVDVAHNYQKHIVVEKPMALKLEDADAMIEACDQAGLKLFVVKQNRYNLPVKKLREALETGRLGKLVLGTVRVRWCRDQAYYDQDPWRGTWAMDGGVFTNQASHHIDLLQWMMGPVESVFARTATMLHNIETEDTGVAVIKFVNGALGVIEATTCARPQDLEGSISILGENGTVEIGGFAANQMKIWQFKNSFPEDEAVVEKYSTMPPNVYGFGHEEFLKKVVHSINQNRKALIDGIEGRKSLEIINALYESTETGKEVFLRFKPKRSKLGQCEE